MASMRTQDTRAAETRGAENRASEDARPSIAWKPPSVLDAPPARPGYRQRWIATSILGKDIPHWVYRQFRQGWNPRKWETIPPEWQSRVPSIKHGQFNGYCGVEGHVLCEMPEETALRREAYFTARTRDLTQHLDYDLNEAERAGGVRFKRERRTTVSRGVRAAPDNPETD